MAKQESGLTQEEFVAEAQALVADLAFYARRAIRLRLVGGDHIAYTYNTADEKHPIDIVLNPNCIEGVRTKERARSIVRGIGLHELMHHLFPAEEQYKIAIAEGFKSLFNLIDDEHIERNGRSIDASWGAHFQTVCAHIFPMERALKNTRLTVGIPDGDSGQKEDEPTGIEADDTYAQRWNEFAFRLRRHFPKLDSDQDPVARALRLIPEEFKDLDKESLLELTRRVHHTLAEGVSLPDPKRKVKADPAQKPEKAAPEPPKSKGKGGGGLHVDKAKWSTLLSSKWSYITLGAFVLCWVALFSRGGSDAWFRVAVVVGTTLVSFALLMFGLWRLKKYLEARKDTAAGKLKAPKQRKWMRRLHRFFARFKHRLGDFLSESMLNLLVRFTRLKIWSWVWQGMKATGRGIRWCFRKTVKAVVYLWHQKWLRIGLVAAPLAVIGLMLWAVFMKAGKVNWLFAAIVLIVLLAWLIVAWIYRKKISAFLIGEILVDADFESGFSSIPPMDLESIEFNQITDIELIEPDKDFLAWALPVVQPMALALREVLTRVGSVNRDKEYEPVGDDLIDDIEQLYMGESNVFVDDQKLTAASLHIEVAVDCSGSMMSENETLKRGEKFKLAKLFSLLVEEATKDQRGISAHFWGFTDSTIYDCGLSGQYRTSGLESSGGNNDSAMLWHMGQSAAASNKSVKMLFMLSDGQPSDCSWGSLRNLVLHFEGAGMVPWHFALDKIENSAFERFFTDLCGQPLEEAIMTMVGILSAIAREQRS